MRIDDVVARAARACRRAFAWLVPFGVVFAATAGSATAQITISDPKTAPEDGRVTIDITARVRIPANASSTPTSRLVVRATPAPASGDVVTTDGGSSLPTEAESGDYETPEAVILPIANSASTPVTSTVSGSMVFVTRADAEEAEDDAVRLTFTVENTGSYQGADNVVLAAPTPSTRDIVIQDNETQAFEWDNLSSNPTEGQSATVTLQADPSPGNLVWRTNLSVSRPGYTLSSTSETLSSSAARREVTITAEAQDRNRTDDAVELRALLAGTGRDLPGLEPLSIEFADIHRLPDPDDITWRAYTDSNGSPSTRVATVAVEGGPPVHVTVTVDRGSNGYPLGETLIVTPAVADPAQRADFTMEPASIEIASGEGRKSATFQVRALEDADVGSEDLVLNLVVTGKEAANGPGETTAEMPFRIMIGDETTPLLTPKPDRQVTRTITTARTAAAGDDGEFTSGEEFSLGTRDLFVSVNPVQLSVESSDPSVARASAAGDTVTVTAVGGGTATITVTGRVADSATTQATANSATVSFDVTVDEPELEITLESRDNTILEGQSITVTATASRAVSADTTVTLSAVGDSTASPDDFTAEPIRIRAGEMTGMTVVSATADNDDTERSEKLTLEGRFGSNMTTNRLTFTIWDRGVPALPFIAQILLAVFLAVGGYRRYLRRR